MQSKRQEMLSYVQYEVKFMGVMVCAMQDGDEGLCDSECEHESGETVWTAKKPNRWNENQRWSGIQSQ